MFDENPISNFKVGDCVEFEKMLEIGDVDKFIDVSGDSSGIHLDHAFAVARGYSGRVAHGVLLGSFISAVIGTKLPGNSGELQSLNLNFRAPVIPPELLKVVVEITGISVSVNQLRLSVSVYRSDGVRAVSGEARTIVGRRSPLQ